MDLNTTLEKTIAVKWAYNNLLNKLISQRLFSNNFVDHQEYFGMWSIDKASENSIKDFFVSFSRNNRINTEGSVLLAKGLAINDSLKHLKVKLEWTHLSNSVPP